MNTRREFLKWTGLAVLGGAGGCMSEVQTTPRAKPNLVFIFIDDMGYGDLSCYGNDKVQTPNIDRLAAEGVRLTQFYVNSPICSPSRTAMMTGMYPARWGIHSYLNSREQNEKRDMADYLDLKAPMLSRTLQKAGYATGHFGKWHMGGGRDVDDAPHPQEYGFDESYVSFEGLGDRQLIRNDGLSNASAKLGQGEIRWVEKYEMTQNYVDRAADFIRRHKDRPFYINLWPNDVHDPHIPHPELANKYKDIAAHDSERKFFAVLEGMDRQIGRFLDFLKWMDLEENTIVLLSSDNGPTDWPRYYNQGHVPPPGSAGLFRGRKWSLYEGGIRMPFLIRWKGTIPAGKTNDKSVVCGADLFPSLCAMAGIESPQEPKPDGEDMSRAFFGEPGVRINPIFWEYPRTGGNPLPGNPDYISPNLAMREGKWKLLINANGKGAELYNLENDPGETTSLVRQEPEVMKQMSIQLLQWRAHLP